MATCKNCVHFDVCCSYISTAYNKCELATPDFKLLKNVECDECQHFKDRSRFVELPCKLGDEIFCTTRGKIYQGIVGRIELDDEGVAIITTDGYCFDSSICYHTQEAAEQAMKEREKHGSSDCFNSKRDN